jgi:hypothetical protein
MSDLERIKNFLDFGEKYFTYKYPMIKVQSRLDFFTYSDIQYGFLFSNKEKLIGIEYIGIGMLNFDNGSILLKQISETIESKFKTIETKRVFSEVDPFGEEEWEY